MFCLDEDEVRYVLRGLAPRARSEGVAEELRGWRWDGAPLAPLYDAALDVAEIADQRCPTSRDVYLRHVLGVEARPEGDALLEQTLRDAVCALVIRAKHAIYEYGPLAAERVRSLAAPVAVPRFPVVTAEEAGTSAALELLWGFERRRVAARIEATLAREPGISADALVAAALPLTVGRRLDGRYLGLAAHIAVDAVGYPEPVAFSFRLGKPERWHRLTPTGHALLLEGLHETPVNLGVIAYVTLADGQVTVSRDLFIIDDELRQEFIEGRDQRARLVEEEIDPGVAGDCPESCPLAICCHG
jgi:CRISPR-associated protein Csa1